MKASDRDEAGTVNSRITYSLHGPGADDFAIDSVRGIPSFVIASDSLSFEASSFIGRRRNPMTFTSYFDINLLFSLFILFI